MKFIRNKGNISVFGLLPSRRAIGQQFVKEKKKKRKEKTRKKTKKDQGVQWVSLNRGTNGAETHKEGYCGKPKRTTGCRRWGESDGKHLTRENTASGLRERRDLEEKHNSGRRLL